jgi:hypothetical protein
MEMNSHYGSEVAEVVHTAKQSTAKPVIPRREALIFLVSSLAITLFIISTPLPALAKYSGAVLGWLGVVLFGVAAFNPARCLIGVRLFDGGFEQFRGLRGRKTILYADIEQIVAIQTGNGGYGDEVLLEISNSDVIVQLGEHDLFGTDLHNILFVLPGFQREQYAEAANYQLKWLEQLEFKRFIIFEKA